MSFLDDLAQRLQDAGIGTLGTSIFESSAAVIPTGMGPYITVSETGGMAPTRIQNKLGSATQRPMAQILVRAGRIAGVQEAWPAARAKAWAAYQALDGLFNVTLSGTAYLRVVARQEPTDMGLDAIGNRVQVVFNVEAEKAPS